MLLMPAFFSQSMRWAAEAGQRKTRLLLSAKGDIVRTIPAHGEFFAVPLSHTETSVFGILGL
jgi:hypothetical protein